MTTQIDIPTDSNGVIDETISQKIASELQLSLENALNYNIYLNVFEIKNTIAESLGSILKVLEKQSTEITINLTDENGNPKPVTINKPLISLFNKDKIQSIVAPFDAERVQKQIQEKAEELSKKILQGQKTTGEKIKETTSKFGWGSKEQSKSVLTNQPKIKKGLQAEKEADDKMQDCYNSILTIAKGIELFNKVNPKYSLKLNEIQEIVNYYRYVYVYKLVRNVEELLISRSNNVYVLTYILSSLYDEFQLDQNGQKNYLDITPKYIELFKTIVESRKNSPIIGCTSEPVPICPDKNDYAMIEMLLKSVFQCDKTFQEFINNIELKESIDDIEKDSDIELSDSLKKLQEQGTTLGKVKSILTKGGGLNFDFNSNIRFVNQQHYNEVFTIEKKKVLAQNKRELYTGETNPPSGLAYLFTTVLTINQFKKVENNDLKTAFILFVNKFYNVTIKELNELKNILNDDSFKVQLDALNDIIVTKNEDQKQELIFQAQIYNKQKTYEIEEKTKMEKERQETPPKSTLDTIKNTFGLNKTTTTTVPSTMTVSAPSTKGGDVTNSKSKAEDAIGKLKSVMSNLKPKSQSITVQETKQEGGGQYDEYYEKYLKYKNKYMELKRQMK